MARSFEPRLRSIEHRRGDADRRKVEMEEDAARVMSRLHIMASSFSDETVPRDIAAQARWSTAMHVAWSIYLGSKGAAA